MSNEYDFAGTGATSPLLHLMAQRIPGSLWATDRELRFTEAYGTELDSLGLQTGSVVGKSVGQLLGTAATDDPAVAAHRSALQGGPVDIEISRGERTHEVHVEALRDGSGAVIGCLGFGRDVTDMKKQREVELRAGEQQYRELERRVTERTSELLHTNKKLKREGAERQLIEEQLVVFKAFVEASGSACGMADLDGHITYANPAMVALFGHVSEEDVVGKHVSTYYRSDYIQKRETVVFPMIDRDGFWVGEVTIVPSSGGEVPALQTSFTVTDARKQPIRRGVVITDLRKFKEVERALRESLKELKAIYDGMLDGFSILDMETLRSVRVNSALSEMIGYSEEELLELSVEQAHPSKDLPWIMELAEAVAGGHASRGESIPIRRRDGSVVYVDVASNPINYNGRRCIITFFHDVTDRKRAQEDLLRERETLLRMAKINDHERRLITSSIHDAVVQPTLGSLLLLQACRNGGDRQSSGGFLDCDAALKTLRDASDETTRLVNRLRTPVFDRFGVATAIADLIDQCDLLPQTPEITYSSDAHFPRLAPILEDSLFRIAQEGLSNVCRHSRSERARVTLGLRDNHVRIEIRDWGCGFDLSQLTREGFGLGCIRVRTRILDAELEIDTALSLGTRICVTLPLLLPNDA